ncbi:hypothetical protein ACZ75_12455 [Massilia sp. NR 4-1]|nr:hypothetical protein ACZ75_12455 [Massilia sp. NR 4-1]
MRGILVVFVVLQVLYFALSWGSSGNYYTVFMRVHFYPDGMTLDELLHLGYTQRLIGVGLGLPTLGMLFYAVVQFNSILTYIKDGMIFATRTIAAMQTFTGTLLLYMVLANLERPLRALIVNATMDTPVLKSLFTVSANDLLLVLVSALFYVLTAIMHEGRRLEEENKGFV